MLSEASDREDDDGGDPATSEAGASGGPPPCKKGIARSGSVAWSIDSKTGPLAKSARRSGNPQGGAAYSPAYDCIERNAPREVALVEQGSPNLAGRARRTP